MNYIIVTVFIIVAFNVGMRYERYRIMKNIQHMESILEQPVDSDVINVTISQHDGMVFAYDDSNLYLAHANSTAELIEKLTERFPNKKFMGDPDSAAILLKHMEKNDTI